MKAAKQLIGQWPHARPADPGMYAASISSVLAQYPLGLVHECVDPRTGLAREREFPPTVNAVVEWCNKRLDWHQKVSLYVAPAQKPKRIEHDFSDEHRMRMLKRLSELIHEIIDKKPEGWVRPLGPFEQRGDIWNSRKAKPASTESKHEAAE